MLQTDKNNGDQRERRKARWVSQKEVNILPLGEPDKIAQLQRLIGRRI